MSANAALDGKCAWPPAALWATAPHIQRRDPWPGRVSRNHLNTLYQTALRRKLDGLCWLFDVTPRFTVNTDFRPFPICASAVHREALLYFTRLSVTLTRFTAWIQSSSHTVGLFHEKTGAFSMVCSQFGLWGLFKHRIHVNDKQNNIVFVSLYSATRTSSLCSPGFFLNIWSLHRENREDAVLHRPPRATRAVLSPQETQ